MAKQRFRILEGSYSEGGVTYRAKGIPSMDIPKNDVIETDYDLLKENLPAPHKPKFEKIAAEEERYEAPSPEDPKNVKKEEMKHVPRK